MLAPAKAIFGFFWLIWLKRFNQSTGQTAESLSLHPWIYHTHAHAWQMHLPEDPIKHLWTVMRSRAKRHCPNEWNVHRICPAIKKELMNGCVWMKWTKAENSNWNNAASWHKRCDIQRFSLNYNFEIMEMSTEDIHIDGDGEAETGER